MSCPSNRSPRDPANHIPARPLAQAWQLIGCQVRGLSRHGPCVAPGVHLHFLLGIVGQHGATMSCGACVTEGDLNHTMSTQQKTHTGSLREEVPLTGTRSCQLDFADGIILEVWDWRRSEWGRRGKKTVCRATPAQILSCYCLSTQQERESHSNSRSVVQPRNLLFHFTSSDVHKGGPLCTCALNISLTGFLGRTRLAFSNACK